MASFPSYGTLQADNFTEAPESAVQRTQMESGPPKQLKYKSRVMVQLQVVYGFRSLSDYNNFVTWFRDTINFGADWFDWTEPKVGSTVQARIVGGQYSAVAVNPDGSFWKVSMTVEYWSS